EAGNKPGRLAGRLPDELHLVPVELELGEHEVAVVPQVRWTATADREVAAEEGERRVDIAHGDGDMIDAHDDGFSRAQTQTSRARPRRIGDVRHLPELYEHAVSAARGNESRAVAVARFEAVDDAYAIGLKALEQGWQIGDLE